MDRDSTSDIRFGIISDTHGLFRPEISSLFSGVSHIFHAGDIGKPSVLSELTAVAPTSAVLGNTDIPSWFPELHETEIITLKDKTFMIIHDLEKLDLDPAAAGIDVVIFGHSHNATSFERKDVLYLNPGSAGPPRFRTHPGITLLSFNGKFSIRHLSF